MPITICVDDWGIGPGIAEAVLALASVRRVHAASCMTNLPPWEYGISALTQQQPQVDLGLHFCLTSGNPLSPPQQIPTLLNAEGTFHGFPALLAKSFLGQIRQEDVSTELAAQWNAFQRICGFAPKHFDSHHHVHQLPGVRQAVLKFLAVKKFSGNIRNSSFSSSQLIRQRTHIARSLFISSGALGFRNAVQRLGLKTQDSFCEVFQPRRPQDIHVLFSRIVRAVPKQQALLVVHPAARADEIGQWDGYVQPRLTEFQYMMSGNFLRLLQENIAVTQTANPHA